VENLDVLSLWPSFSLLLFSLVIFLECRVAGGRATMPLGKFLPFFIYGCAGAITLSLLSQQLAVVSLHAAFNPGSQSATTIAWFAGPPIEELAKALPVIALAFFASTWRRLSIADLALIGFASGAGFGFVEFNLAALVNGTLPSFAHLIAFGFQTDILLFKPSGSYGLRSQTKQLTRVRP